MTRPPSNSLRQIQRKNPEGSRRHFNVHIVKVNYVTRHLKVAERGYSGPKKVAVQTGINLGTSDKPIVTTSNIATIEMQEDGTWLCVGIRRKQMCAVGTGGVEDVAVDNDFDPFDSNQTDGFGSLIVPTDLFLPPIEPLGEFTLPDLRFAGGFTGLCNIPPCPECAPDGLVAGMSPILSNEGCWEWGFRGASCGLYFRSQGAYHDYFPVDSFSSLDGQAVAVREHYAYVVRNGVEGVGVGFFTDPHLLVIDVQDPIFPIIVADLTIPSPTATIVNSPGIAVKEDTLWISGTMVSNPYIGLTYGNIMFRYDISSRESPSLVDSWETRLMNDFKVYVHYDPGTETFVGQPYLVGVNWNFNTPDDNQKEFVVDDGLVGGEVQTLSGYLFKVDSTVDTAPFIVCDNTVLISHLDGSDQHVLAIDLFDIPSVISVIWDSPDLIMPIVHLGSNQAYVLGDFDNLLLTQLEIDDTSSVVGGDDFPDNADEKGWGFFVKGNCLLRAGNIFLPHAWSFNIENPVLPIQRSMVNEGIVTGSNATVQHASADIWNNRVFLCSVTPSGTEGVICVYTSP